MKYMVEVTTTPITDGDWSVQRRVLDTIPGALLIEDPEEPTLILPVEAPSHGKVLTFIDGLSTLMGFEATQAMISDEPDDNFDAPDSDGEAPEAVTSPVVEHLNTWMGTMPPLRGSVDADGRLVDA